MDRDKLIKAFELWRERYDKDELKEELYRIDDPKYPQACADYLLGLLKEVDSAAG